MTNKGTWLGVEARTSRESSRIEMVKGESHRPLKLLMAHVMVVNRGR